MSTKPNNPIKQHFVPEVYLNQFSYNQTGDIYCLDFKSEYLNKSMKSYNKSAICYDRDTYTLNDSELLINPDVDNPYFIELNLFDYENSSYNTIIEKVKAKENFNQNEADIMCHFFLSIKHRNPEFKKSFTDLIRRKELTDEYIEKRTKELLNLPEFKGICHQEIITAVRNEITVRLNNSKFNDNLYLDNLINNEINQGSTMEKLRARLMKCHFKIFESPDNHTFITSDNPGHTVDKKGKLTHLAFDVAKYLFMPLTPKFTFGIDLELEDQSRTEVKSIDYIKTDREFVEIANQSTAYLSTRHLYSNNKNALSNFLTTRNNSLR